MAWPNSKFQAPPLFRRIVDFGYGTVTDKISLYSLSTLAMGRAGLGPQKPGPAHSLVGPAHESPARPTKARPGPRAHGPE